MVFQGGYHGRSGYASQLSASHRYRRILGDWRIPLTRLPLPDYERSDFPGSKADWIKWYLREVDMLLKSEVGGVADNHDGDDVAALVVEPILNVSGMILPDKELFEGIVARFKKAGALIIIDEIFTGFYRTGKPFGFCRYDVTPDIVVASKGLTNGQVPIGLIWARNPLLDEQHFHPGTHSATFTNNVMALATADTVLDRYENWKTIKEDIAKVEKTLTRIINNMCQSSTLFKSGYALGGLGRILLDKPIASQVRSTAQALPRNKLKQTPVNKSIAGMILASTGMTPNVINIHPPIKMTDSQLSELSELFAVLKECYD